MKELRREVGLGASAEPFIRPSLFSSGDRRFHSSKRVAIARGHRSHPDPASLWQMSHRAISRRNHRLVPSSILLFCHQSAIAARIAAVAPFTQCIPRWPRSCDPDGCVAVVADRRNRYTCEGNTTGGSRGGAILNARPPYCTRPRRYSPRGVGGARACLLVCVSGLARNAFGPARFSAFSIGCYRVRAVRRDLRASPRSRAR